MSRPRRGADAARRRLLVVALPGAAAARRGGAGRGGGAGARPTARPRRPPTWRRSPAARRCHAGGDAVRGRRPRIARANGAGSRRCVLDGRDVDVRVEVDRPALARADGRPRRRGPGRARLSGRVRGCGGSASSVAVVVAPLVRSASVELLGSARLSSLCSRRCGELQRPLGAALEDREAPQDRGPGGHADQEQRRRRHVDAEQLRRCPRLTKTARQDRERAERAMQEQSEDHHARPGYALAAGPASSVEEPDRAGLVERVVLVAALGRLDARGAALRAPAGGDRLAGRGQPLAAAAWKPRSAKPAPPGWPS